MEQNVVMDAEGIKRALTRMTYEIIERNKGTEDIVIVGVKTRGEYLGKRIAERMLELEGVEVPFIALDISPYRDDLISDPSKAAMNSYLNDYSVDLTDKNVFLIDDVLQTGRTIRAAMDAVMDIGRASNISLVVLVDRGHRELPIRADIIGKNIPTSKSELVQVQLEESDGEDSVIIKKSLI